MSDTTLSGEERLKQKFGTGGILTGTKITDLTRRYMESLEFFFMATADQKGNCDCSFRGGFHL
ncbi:hypothetical protein [Chengkuizengella axinellae]|uniref:Uncharacterized protein n=1 Tax=Chengkuizengella axinellae TaxID=3064388 RepID=A0ABT9IYN2_9BACL|nr:hypothetical protein [Chengkuizengella sp. 2205SS18-9]MDP5274476.1 hypothetical protein [Chengkuizengella sp. 2205SS18-9]